MMILKLIIWQDVIAWYNVNKNGFFQEHRSNNQPSIIFEDGTKYWYINGQIIKKQKIFDIDENIFF